MDDPRDRMLVEHTVESSPIRDVTPHDRDPTNVVAEHEVEPMRGIAEVEADDLDTSIEERSCRPRP